MESYKAEQELKNFKPEPNWDLFKTMKPKRGRASDTALVSIGKSSVAFNKQIINDKVVFQNVEIRVAPPAKIMFLFKQKPDANTYRVTINRSGCRVASPFFATRLAEKGDLRIDLFHYKFKPYYYDPKQHRLVINLMDTPYSKVAIKKGK